LLNFSGNQFAQPVLKQDACCVARAQARGHRRTIDRARYS
jgi:hypothetical protein